MFDIKQAVQCPPFYCIGLQVRTSNKTFLEDTQTIRSAFYDTCMPKIPHRIDSDVLSVYSDYEGNHTQQYNYTICCRVSTLDNLPEGMVGVVVPEQTYSVFNCRGEFPESLMEAWNAVWQSDDLDRKRNYNVDFEVYGMDFHTNPEKPVDLYIGCRS